jgi:hypothetical protein
MSRSDSVSRAAEGVIAADLAIDMPEPPQFDPDVHQDLTADSPDLVAARRVGAENTIEATRYAPRNHGSISLLPQPQHLVTYEAGRWLIAPTPYPWIWPCRAREHRTSAPTCNAVR